MNKSLKTYSDFIKSEPENHVNIFGAGAGAYYLTKDILKNHKKYTIDSFFVSDREGNVNNCFSIPVRVIDECLECLDTPIIIGTLEWLHTEIYQMLADKGFCKIYALSDEEYKKIRQDSPDSEADVFFAVQRVESVTKRVEESISKLKEKIDCIERRLDDFIQQNFYKTYVKYKACHEIYYERDFKEYREREDFDQLVDELVKNLDKNSRDEVYRIIHRLNLLCDGGTIEFFEKEREKLEEIHQKFTKNIYCLGNRVVYRDYILPKGTLVETSVFWYQNGLSQLKYMDRIKKKAVIDAGGYIGDSAILFSEMLEGMIYSFEMAPRNNQYMKKVIEWNHLERVIPVEKALMDKTGEMEFYVGSVDNCDYNSLYQLEAEKYEENKIKVPCISIDEFVEENNLEIGLIKADVEGAERYLISGARETIKSQHPTLIISIYHSIEDFFSLKLLVESIYDGYEMQIFRPVLEYSFLEETVLICEVKE